MTWQSGSGGGGYPGVTTFTGPPPGIIVAGEVVAEGLLTAQGGIFGPTLKTLPGGGVRIDKITDESSTLEMHLSSPSAGWEVALLDVSSNLLYHFDADGSGGTFRAFSMWNHSVPATQPILATGAGNTVDDVITLLQSYGICKQS